MKTTVKNELDINAAPDDSLLALAIFVTDAAKEYFGKPAAADKLAEWRAIKAATYIKERV